MSEVDLEAAKINMLRRQLRARHCRSARACGDEQNSPGTIRSGRVPRRGLCRSALSIDCGQTISQPYIVALMTEALELSGKEKVLEVGTGSGYQTAILAELAREVFSIERIAELSMKAGDTLRGLGYENVRLQVGDGTLGWPEQAPFDGIIVTAMAERCPRALFDQLCEGGLIVIPIGGYEHQNLQAIKKVSGVAKITVLTGCRFVPLIGAQGWSDE